MKGRATMSFTFAITPETARNWSLVLGRRRLSPPGRARRTPAMNNYWQELRPR